MRQPSDAKRVLHWAFITETGTTIGMSILIFVYRIGGRRLFKLLLFPVIIFYYLLRTDSRKASRQYLQRVRAFVPEMPNVTWRLIFSHFWQFALSIIDKFGVWMGKINEDGLITHNLEIIDRLIAQNQGAILNVSHFGNFEILNALSQKHKGVKLTILHHTKHAEKFNRVLKKYNASSNVTLLQVTDLNAALGMQLIEKIGAGEFLAIASDRVPVSNKTGTVRCRFFGEHADFPIGSYVLANLLRAPIIMVFCFKELGTYNAYFETLSEPQKLKRSERGTFIAAMAQKFATRLEHYVSRQPLQWFNFYDFWAAEK